MRRSGLMGERLIALFLLGIVLFTPPFLGIFNVATVTAGIPTFYLYLFSAWLALIVLVALAAERGGHLDVAPQAGEPPAGEESDASARGGEG
ncbi:MAG: hypothetical protein AB1749_05980 [Pseudomonadota bacterium]